MPSKVMNLPAKTLLLLTGGNGTFAFDGDGRNGVFEYQIILPADIKKNREFIKIDPQHVSLYSLSVEPGKRCTMIIDFSRRAVFKKAS